ncbi:flagellar basal body rod protein FlgB [Salisediminibacterium halotolerans]|uniref:Flagellar basal body rod protein FlgB n=1 Tax=Salisediminibacterium halotolerans TaxID=517425 RepID=A0A1H9Q2G8_9BACI|nr:flagellar basal body rod protein FlgB [Salisediminibacterium haloalkalitolerans]SER54776.1 flagellar basal-body rod protein FlgB [Salisediminibacterium haloalkalitolerans]
MDVVNNSLNQLLQTSLNASSGRQKSISNNIANVDTPNYSAEKTKFNHQLQDAMEDQRLNAHQNDNRHVEFGGGPAGGQPETLKRKNTDYNHNGNNVDIDLEMSQMAENQVYYNALIDRLNGRFNSVRTVLGQGGA